MKQKLSQDIGAMADSARGVSAYVVERRRGRRYKLNWAIKVRGPDSDGDWFEEVVTLRDLSATGAFVYLNFPLKVGARLSISIELPFKKQGWMNYLASVVRIENISTGAGVALKFDSSRPTFA